MRTRGALLAVFTLAAALLPAASSATPSSPATHRRLTDTCS